MCANYEEFGHTDLFARPCVMLAVQETGRLRVPTERETER